MKNTLIFLACLFLFSKNVFGQKTARATIDQYFQTVLKNSPAPGFSVVVVSCNEIIFSKGYGVEKAGFKKPMTAETSTAIGSLTKSFTAMAMMQLVEQGKVRLDDPVVKYLPEFRTANKGRSDKITVRMLLNNTSGLHGGVTQNWQDTDQSLERLMMSLQSVFLKREPGSAYEYSNAAFSVAGLLISRASGMSYPAYLKKHIFQPLEMKRSTTDPADFDALHVLYGHHLGLRGGIPAVRGIETGEMAPAGLLLRSSAEDLGHYLVVLLNGGSFSGTRVLTQKSIEKMWSPQISFPGLTYEKGGDGSDYHYGLGWMISKVEGRTIIHHGGSNGTMSSMTIIDPERQLAASILFNLDYNFVDSCRYQSAFSILNNLFQLVENEKLTDFGNPRIPDPTLNNFELPENLKERFTGKYRFAGSAGDWVFQGATLEIFTGQNGQLEVQAKQGSEIILHFALDFTNEANAVSRNVEAAQPVHFKVRPDGVVTGLYFSGSEFKKVAPDFLEKYNLVQLEGAAISFYFPKNWQAKKQDNRFEAIKKAIPGTSVTAGVASTKNIDFQEIVKNNLPGYQVIFEGLEMTQARGRQLWREQSFSTSRGGKNYQHLVLWHDATTTGFYLILTTPEGMLTEAVQEVAGVLMETFSER